MTEDFWGVKKYIIKWEAEVVKELHIWPLSEPN